MNHAYTPCNAIVRGILFLGAAAFLLFFSNSATAAPLEDAFAALTSYEFGMDDEAIVQISAAVRAAAAGQADAPCTRGEIEQRLAALVSGEATLDAKLFACRMLGEMGGEVAAAALGKMLKEEGIFQTALTALENNPSDSAMEQMVAAFDQASEERKPALLIALGRQGNPAAAKLISAHLEDAPETALAAAQALADMGAPEACQGLVDKVVNGTPEQRLFFADPCLRCAAKMPAETAVPCYELLRDAAFPVHIRLAAISGLLHCRPEQAPVLIGEALQDKDPVMASDALALAKLAHNESVSAALTAVLATASPERKPALTALVAELGDAGALPVVTALVNHDVAEVRRAALRAMAVLGNAGQAPLLLDKAVDGPPDEQRLARESLARISAPGVNVFLLETVSSSAEEAKRLAAITALAERRADEAVDALLALAAKESPAIRSEAVNALRALADGGRLPALVALVAAPGLADIRDALTQAITQIAARIDDPEMRADVVLEALGKSDSPEQTALLMDALGLIGGNKAFDAVCGAVNATHPEVRRAAITALSRFQREEALQLLQEILLKESDGALRAKAYSGYMVALRNASTLGIGKVQPHVRAASEQARSISEKREFLAAATQLPSLETLRIIESMMGDAEISAEAARAAARVGTALIGAYPEAARTMLAGLTQRSDIPAPLLEDVNRALAVMDKFDGYVMAWEMAGPYMEDQVSGEALFDREFSPEKDADAAPWRILPVLPDADPAYALELDRVVGGEDRVVFLRTKLIADESQAAMLELGTNDGCRVWWNGALIHAIKEGRAFTPGQDKLPVQLNAGVNDLMIAVFQQGGAWRASVRLTDADGKALKDLKTSPAVE